MTICFELRVVDKSTYGNAVQYGIPADAAARLCLDPTEGAYRVLGLSNNLISASAIPLPPDRRVASRGRRRAVVMLNDEEGSRASVFRLRVVNEYYDVHDVTGLR